jgi:hypothetical protein
MLKQIVERRERLVARSAAEREAVCRSAAAAARKLVLVDTLSVFLQRIGWRPLLLGAGLLASLSTGPRKALFWATRASALLSAYRQARRLFDTHR